MSLFKADSFLEKLTRVELKKHFQKKKIVMALYLQGPMTLSETMKGLEVSAPTLQNLINELIKEEIMSYGILFQENIPAQCSITLNSNNNPIMLSLIDNCTFQIKPILSE